MADTNQISAEMEAILRQAQEDLKNFGFVTQDTADRLKGAEAQAKKFETAMGLGGKAVTSLAKAGMEAASAMYEGKKGAAAFNSSVDSMATAAMAAGAALTLMAGPFGVLVAAATLAVAALAKYTKAANEMSDKLYTSFQKMSKSGAAASDGMTGIYDGMQKLGLGIQDLDGYVTLLNENSQDLALFGGAVFEGRKRFEDMGAAMKPFREQLYNAGLNQEAVNKGAMGYLKLQTQLGRSQTMSTQQLADGAKKYLIEQDALTKLTGQSREEMEKQAEAALMEEQYASKIRELELAGNTDAVEALRKMNAVYSQAGPEMGRAFRASITGNLSNADAQKANLSSNGEMVRTSQAVIAGQMDFKDAINTTGKAMGKTADTVGTTLGQFGAYNDTFGNFSEQQKLRMITEKDLNSTLAKIDEDQKKQGVQGGKAADAAQQAQTDLRLVQLDAMKATQNLVFDGIVPATKAMILLAEGTAAAAKALRGIPGTADKEERTKDAYVNSEAVGAAGEIGQVMAEGQIEAGKQPEPEKIKSVNEMSWFDKMLVGKENLKKREAAEAAGQTPAQASAPAAPSASASPAPAAGQTPAQASAPAAPSASASPAPAGGRKPAGGGGAPGAPPVNLPYTSGTPGPAQSAPSQSTQPVTTYSDRLLNFIKSTERFTPTAFWDSQQWTNGYGTKAKSPSSASRDDREPKETVDEPTAITRMTDFLQGAVSNVITYGKKNGYNWNQGQVDALTSFSYNAGLGAINKLTDGGKRSNEEIALKILEYNKAKNNKTGEREVVPGLDKRRKEELSMFQAKDGGVFDGPNSGYPATLHGPEAVIPLKNGSVPVTISSTGLMDQMPKMDMDSEMSDKISQSFAKGMPPEFKNLVDSLSTMVQQQQNTNSTAIQEQMVALLEDMRRSMQTTATASERMVAYASN